MGEHICFWLKKRTASFLFQCNWENLTSSQVNLIVQSSLAVVVFWKEKFCGCSECLKRENHGKPWKEDWMCIAWKWRALSNFCNFQNFNCSRDVEPKTKLSLVWFSLKVFHWFSPLALITKLNGKQLWNIEELCQINKWCLPWSHCNFCKGAKIDAAGYKTPKEQSHCVKVLKLNGALS